eukprot:jgi/Mesvir1/13574/Mv26129-RA.1
MAEDEPARVKDDAEEACKPSCVAKLLKYEVFSSGRQRCFLPECMLLPAILRVDSTLQYSELLPLRNLIILSIVMLSSVCYSRHAPSGSRRAIIPRHTVQGSTSTSTPALTNALLPRSLPSSSKRAWARLPFATRGSPLIAAASTSC